MLEIIGGTVGTIFLLAAIVPAIVTLGAFGYIVCDVVTNFYHKLRSG